jgi:putative copper export protein
MTSLRDEDKATITRNVVGRARIWVHSAITGILISGLYNLHKVWSKTVFPYGFIFMLKLVLAMIVFTVAILLTSSSPQRAAFQSNRKTWLTLNVGLAVIIVAISAFLRTLH